MLRRFATQTSGAAAVEFAIVAPVIVAMVVAGFMMWNQAARAQDVRTGLDAAAQYYMAGGQNDDIAKALAQDAMAQSGIEAEVSSSRICRCGSVAAQCGTTCSAGRRISEYVQLEAAAPENQSSWFKAIDEDRVIRVK